ncbi:uncharacterized protein LOC129598391 [Paramacrobiotus metropolitanus]|uniref:uncharacterized protein LOC129598391 n=1 Tax=Paramacrobiotus metropolitanus TaxID=2943436 RepID=UPI002446178F|nr:uncharacterized protein LOC129598391 [Paramacrobiotus metropolitanus]
MARCATVVPAVWLILVASSTWHVAESNFRFQGSDSTVSDGAKGSRVVRAVMQKLESVCIFKRDKQMLRTIAVAASDDGVKAGTFRPGYYGGIWQVDEALFLRTKDYSLSYLWSRFNSAFNIDWQTVQWQDLTKPLYSALAARLVLASVAYENDNNIENGLPWDLPNQASIWISSFNLHHDVNAYQNYHTAAQKLRDTSGCKSVGADIAFIMDGSASVGTSDFQHSLNFVTEVISRLNIGPTSNQVSMIQYSSTAVVELYFNTFAAKDQVLQKIASGIAYQGGGTATEQALWLLDQNVFAPSNGARGQSAIPQFAVLFTDGHANDPMAAQVQAAQIHAKNITLLSVGIGGINELELNAYASQLKCKNTYHLQGFSDMAQMFAFELEQRSCTDHGNVVPLPEDPETGQLPPPVMIVLQPNQEQYICFLVHVSLGATLIINGTSGTLTMYFSFSVSQPIEENYDKKITVTAGHVETLYLTPSIIKAYVGDIVQETQICITLAADSSNQIPTPFVSTTLAPTPATNTTVYVHIDPPPPTEPWWMTTEPTTEVTEQTTTSLPTDNGASGTVTVVEGSVGCGAAESNMQDNDKLLITSPHFDTLTNQPAGYRQGLSCVWRINTPAWTTLEITVTYFRLQENHNVEPGRTCNSQDRVIIADTAGVVSGGYLCGSRLTGFVIPVTRTLNQTTISFTSISNASREFGFSLTVRAIGRHRLDCSASEINVEMRKLYLPAQTPVGNYRLLNDTCRASETGTALLMRTSYGQCGTIRSIDDENVYFVNQASAAGGRFCTGPICVNAPAVDIPFRCKLERMVKPVSGSVSSHHPRNVISNRPFLEGIIDVGASLELGYDLNFDQPSQSAFLDFDFQSQKVYFEVSVKRRFGSSVAFIVQADQCWTTPTSNKNDPIRFDILLDGCPVDTPGFDLQFRRHYTESRHKDIFSVNALHFNETSDLLHFHCIVRVCSVGVDEGLCDTSCQRPISVPAPPEEPGPEIRTRTSPVVLKKEAAMQRTAQLGSIQFRRMQHRNQSH